MTTPITIINDSKYFADATYYRTNAIQPELIADGKIADAGTTLHLTTGKGSSRSWGRPAVTSTVAYQSNDLVVVHVGWTTKHVAGQRYFFFRRNDAGLFTRVTARAIKAEQRAQIAEATKAARVLPSWAAMPFAA